MVNKQYNIQSTKKSKNYSPPPNRCSTVISSAPNPTSTVLLAGNNLDSLSEENNSSQSVYGRNITYLSSDHFGISDDNFEGLNNQNVSINDIGRFQYILQMDREMVSEIVFKLDKLVYNFS